MSTAQEYYRATRQHVIARLRTNQKVDYRVDVDETELNLRLYVEWDEDGKGFIYESKPVRDNADGQARMRRMFDESRYKTQLLHPTIRETADSIASRWVRELTK